MHGALGPGKEGGYRAVEMTREEHMVAYARDVESVRDEEGYGGRDEHRRKTRIQTTLQKPNAKLQRDRRKRRN